MTQSRLTGKVPVSHTSLQLFTDTAGKGPVVSPASLQEPLFFRCRLMLQQRKVTLHGVLPGKYRWGMVSILSMFVFLTSCSTEEHMT